MEVKWTRIIMMAVRQQIDRQTVERQGRRYEGKAAENREVDFVKKMTASVVRRRSGDSFKINAF